MVFQGDGRSERLREARLAQPLGPPVHAGSCHVDVDNLQLMFAQAM